MSEHSPWVTDDNVALLTDLYQLTMLQAYWHEGMDGEAVFSLFARRLPPGRNYLLACGLDDALRFLETFHFSEDARAYLATLDLFRENFLDWLGDLRFEGDVYAVPEGTPVFPDEPIVEVVGPIAQAQLAETFLMNQVHHQTVVASKAVRVVAAARDRAVVDFGLRRMHGTDAGVKAARAFHVAGLAATSNVLAGQIYDLPVTGTMAHSYVQAHDEEMGAFRAFSELYPETTLLVDTYDTLEGVEKVVELARERGDGFRVQAIRLDSGDLAELAKGSRKILDEGGLEDVQIFASGGLDEWKIADILDRGAPIDGFGVGTGLGVSKDAPSLDVAYKLTSYAGRGRVKLSPGKRILPGRKQVFRIERGGVAIRDVLARWDEDRDGRPLLRHVMQGGERLDAGREDLETARSRAREEIAELPERTRALEDADPPYPVKVSETLTEYQEDVIEEVSRPTRR